MIGFAAIETSRGFRKSWFGFLWGLKVHSSSFSKCFPLYVNEVLPQSKVLQKHKTACSELNKQSRRRTGVKFFFEEEFADIQGQLREGS